MLLLSRTVLNRKNVPYKTDKGNSRHHQSLLYNSGGSQSQRIDLARNSLEEVRGQKPDGSDDTATTTSA